MTVHMFAFSYRRVNHNSTKIDIVMENMKALGLEEGATAVAIIKATDVMVAVD